VIRWLRSVFRRTRDGAGSELREQVAALKTRTDAAVAHADSQVRRARLLDSYDAAGRVLGDRRQ
jgi:hypothetical protein